LKFGCSKIASLATDTEKQTKQTNKQQQQKEINIRSRHFAKQRNKNSKQTNKQKLFTRSNFCNINTQRGSKDVIQARQQRPESPAVTHLTCV